MAEALFQISEPGQSRVKAPCTPGFSRAVGIDLGTTNSLVAMVQNGKPVCLSDDGGDPIVPSVVHYASDGDIIVGAVARDVFAPAFPSDTIASVKRFMGRGPRDAEATRKLTPYVYAPGAEHDAVVRFAVAGGRAVTPLEVSAEILRVLKARAEAALGAPLEGVVITVPAYFDDGQRQATRDAGRLAGLEVLRLLNEPTAAALAYGLDKATDGRSAEGTFAVFDLGGGTFDVSILKLEAGVFEVKATGGDSALGGDDFDRAIAGALLARLGLPADAGGDRKLTRRIFDAARALKHGLTDAPEASVQIALDASVSLPLDERNQRSETVTLTRVEMEALVRPVLDRCAPSVRRALADAGLPAEALSGVILVGGATRMPLVRRFVKELFGREPLADIDPDQVVALGAAVQADILAGDADGQRADVLLLDVVPLSLGLETMGGVVEKLIHRNTTVPCGATQTFTTYADKQTGFDLHVVQGEREMVDEVRSLARFKLGGIPPLPAGLARLEVTFLVDADGILRVNAREETTGQETSIQVKPSYGLTDEQVEQMLLDSFTHAEDDVKTRLLAEQRVEAKRILGALHAATADTPELLTDDDRRAIAAAQAALDQTVVGTDANAIRAAVEGLDRASKPFAEKRMNRAFDTGLRGQDLATVEAKVTETESKTDLRTRVDAHAGHKHG
jgi:molecular chaperone HscA